MDGNFTKIFALIRNTGINIEQVKRLRLSLYLSLSNTQYFGQFGSFGLGNAVCPTFPTLIGWLANTDGFGNFSLCQSSKEPVFFKF